jgi:heme-degrading monooxygenase HmoA
MIFVFEVRIRPGYTAEQYAEAWVRASEIIQSAPGARGTRLHRKIGEPDALLAIASWASKADRDAAEDERDPRVQRILDEQAECVDIRIVGAYEEPDWVVRPPAAEGGP